MKRLTKMKTENEENDKEGGGEKGWNILGNGGGGRVERCSVGCD